MSDIKVKFSKDMSSVIAKAINDLKLNALKNAKDAIAEATLVIHGNARKNFRNSGGTKQKRYNPERVVSVSNPGDTPNTDRGRAVQSVNFELDTIDGNHRGKVGTNLLYAMWLEFGTKKMAPRPWLSVAVTESIKDIKNIFIKYSEKTIKDSSK